jgi:hypothetical protein
LALKLLGAVLVDDAPILEFVRRREIADPWTAHLGDHGSLATNHARKLRRTWAEPHLFKPSTLYQLGDYAAQSLDRLVSQSVVILPKQCITIDALGQGKRYEDRLKKPIE